MALVVSVLALLTSLVSISAAQAAAGSAFDASTPAIFASKSANQGDATRLYRLAPQGNGTYAYAPVGPDANLVYNALTYNTDDRYMYAISGDPLASGVPSGSLLKIGSDGGYDVIGTDIFQEGNLQTNMGAYDPDTKVFYVLSAQGSQIFRIDLDTSSATYGELLNTVNINPVNHDGIGGGSDLTYSNGAFWTLGRNGIFRIALDGTTTNWPTPAGAASSVGGNDQAGAAWTYLGGDLGFSYNGSGEVVRIAVDNPNSANPTFTTKVKSGGSPSGQNDGAAIQGSVDLSIKKVGDFFQDGDRVRYTLEVTNLGGADSTGFTVTDDIPAGLKDFVVSGDGTSTVAGNKVTITGGPLAVGAKATLQIVATVGDSLPDSFTNTGVVVGQDVDRNDANNQSSATLKKADDGDDNSDDDDLESPDTGAQRSPMWPWTLALGLGLALIVALGARTAVGVKRKR